ncbi:MAG: hypothetical protein ACREX9_07230 [Gammaproteobacteria bacterium]
MLDGETRKVAAPPPTPHRVERPGTGLATADLDHVVRIALPLPFF